MKAHVSESKKKVVKEFATLIDKYPIIAAVNMENLPAKQLQHMREQLRGEIVLRMTKKRLIINALNESKKKGIEKLTDYLKGMPALLFTDKNPFTLFKILKKNKSKAPIKAGQTAPNDIVVPAGPTGFAPGPIISELAQVGIKSGVEDGKIAIKSDSIVAKEGDVINSKLAALLTRLGIEPMEVGLGVTAVYENGEIITKDILDIDEESYIKMIVTAVSEANNLSFNIAYPTKDNIKSLLNKAHSDSYTLAIEQNIFTKDTISVMLCKVENTVKSISAKVLIQKEES